MKFPVVVEELLIIDNRKLKLSMENDHNPTFMEIIWSVETESGKTRLQGLWQAHENYAQMQQRQAHK